jgi:uncharacterized membrane protein SpoIIM required for sporulation
VPLRAEEERHLARLGAILREVGSRGPRGLSERALDELPRLYRFASSLQARLQTSGDDAAALARLRPLLFAAHGLLHREPAQARGAWLGRIRHLFLIDAPRTIRVEWRLLCASLVLLYGLAAASYGLVRHDLGLAYSLMDPSMVATEIEQLRAVEAGGAFRGNFDFGSGASPVMAGAVMGNNVRVSLLFFASALVPPLYVLLLASNALMLGTYLAVAAHWNQAGSISSILWCHGTLEIQAIVLAGTAGLALLRGIVAPGPWSRAYALRLAGKQSLRLLAPVFPMLVVAGLLEGYVSPHAPTSVRILVAIASGVLLLTWVVRSGRVKEHTDVARSAP